MQQPEEGFRPRLAWAVGDVSVVEVRPDALLRRTSKGACGAAWKSTRDETWTGWRPDRDGGLVRRGMPSRLIAVMFLAAVVADA